jgi:hypothetical protein
LEFVLNSSNNLALSAEELFVIGMAIGGLKGLLDIGNGNLEGLFSTRTKVVDVEVVPTTN